jgi:hypothetical protein
MIRDLGEDLAAILLIILFTILTMATANMHNLDQVSISVYRKSYRESMCFEYNLMLIYN